MIPSVPRVKPKLRGVFHELGFYAAIALGVPLVLTADHGRARIAAIVFASCLAGCFGASALYHRRMWTARVRSWLARLDHAGVYLLIAGTYTPFGLLVMSGGWAVPVLSVVWSGAIVAIMLKLFWVREPKWLSAAIGLALGWVGVIAFSQLLKIEVVGLLLVVAGGLLYSAGAIVYALAVQIPHRTSSATTSSSTCSRSPPPAASSRRSRSSSSLAPDREAGREAHPTYLPYGAPPGATERGQGRVRRLLSNQSQRTPKSITALQVAITRRGPKTTLSRAWDERLST